jgi:hypothetical protein
MIFDLMMCEKTAGLARIFGGNQIDFPQCIERSDGNVFAIANRGGDHIQAPLSYIIAQYS